MLKESFGKNRERDPFFEPKMEFTQESCVKSLKIKVPEIQHFCKMSPKQHSRTVNSYHIYKTPLGTNANFNKSTFSRAENVY